MTYAWLLGQRALREAWRTPDALLPTLFIPLFFLVVNTGQAAKIFPGESTEFLERPGLRRVPAAGLAAARRVVRDGRPVPRRGDRGRLLRQAASRPDPAHGHRARPADRGVRQGPRDRDRRDRARDGLRHRDRQRAARLRAAGPADRPVVGGLPRLPADHRAQDAQRGGHQLGQPDLLPAAVPDPELRAARAAHAADGDRRDAQPRHLRDGGAALADPAGPRLGRRSCPASAS